MAQHESIAAKRLKKERKKKQEREKIHVEASKFIMIAARSVCKCLIVHESKFFTCIQHASINAERVKEIKNYARKAGKGEKRSKQAL